MVEHLSEHTEGPGLRKQQQQKISTLCYLYNRPPEPNSLFSFSF